MTENTERLDKAIRKLLNDLDAVLYFCRTHDGYRHKVPVYEQRINALNELLDLVQHTSNEEALKRKVARMLAPLPEQFVQFLSRDGIAPWLSLNPNAS